MEPLSAYNGYLLFFPSLGLPELIVLFLIILVIFGPGKLPQVGKALGDGINQFRKATRDAADEITGGKQSEPSA